MVLGWDIGGVHTKVAMVVSRQIVCVREEPFELQRQPEALVSLCAGWRVKPEQRLRRVTP